MSQQRYSLEFKDEAVRHATERGHSVQEVAARLGVSSHSLYQWVKAVKPSKSDERAGEGYLSARRGAGIGAYAFSNTQSLSHALAPAAAQRRLCR